MKILLSGLKRCVCILSRGKSLRLIGLQRTVILLPHPEYAQVYADQAVRRKVISILEQVSVECDIDINIAGLEKTVREWATDASTYDPDVAKNSKVLKKAKLPHTNPAELLEKRRQQKREAGARYRKTEKCKARNARYNGSEKAIAQRKRNEPRVKESRARYRASEKGKATKLANSQREEVKAAKRAWHRGMKRELNAALARGEQWAIEKRAHTRLLDNKRRAKKRNPNKK